MKWEVLAPVGRKSSLESAVFAGADAVYVGLTQFSARSMADNFDGDALCAAVKFCHSRGVKLYLALNTLIKDDEFDDALINIKLACNASVDAIIVQDLGLVSVLKNVAPDMPLHASTQLSVHSLNGALYLKKLGISRVVLARELSVDEITVIANGTDIELEVFVHGALCMSVSGQCYFSASLGGRSGNRGACAQTCRLPFSAPFGTGYDLSLKDNCLLNEINRLKEIGVTSFKIEGRQKSAEYVAISTKAYRNAVDNGEVAPELLAMLQTVFSRSGFTSGYFNNNRSRDMFGTRTENDKVSSKSTNAFAGEITRREFGRVAINICVYAYAGKPLCVTVSDNTHTLKVAGTVCEQAEHMPTSKEKITLACTKLGGTPFFLQNIKYFTDGLTAVNISNLNALKKQLCAQLLELRSIITPVNCANELPDLSVNKTELIPKLLARFSSVQQISDDFCSDEIAIPLESSVADITAVTARFSKVYLEIPRAIFGIEPLIIKQIKSVKNLDISGFITGNIAGVNICLELGVKYALGFGSNIINSYALSCEPCVSADFVMISPELPIASAVLVAKRFDVAALVYGHLPVMLTRNCPLKNGADCASCAGSGFITDRKGIKFLVSCRYKTAEIYNAHPTYLLDLEEISHFSKHILYFTSETASICSEILAAYNSKLKPRDNYNFTRGIKNI